MRVCNVTFKIEQHPLVSVVIHKGQVRTKEVAVSSSRPPVVDYKGESHIRES